MLKRPSRKTIVIGTGGVLLIVALFVELKWHPVTNWFRAQDWRWTGLSEYTAKRTEEKDPKGQVTKITEEVQAGKTGWDYLQLAGAVAVPLVLGFGGFWLNQQEQRRVEAREEQDQKRAEANLTLERERAEENIREEALQTYLDRISELLLSNNLGKPYPENNPAQDIARARTLTVLERLGGDGERKGAILRFLYEAELLKGDKPVVDLSKANLRKANLRKANLRGAFLRGAILSEAILSEADLSSANLRGADLNGAYLRGAILSEAILRGANLRGAYLSGANLSGAYLSEAILSGANLSEADLSSANLSGADLNGAIYNNSTKFPAHFDPVKAGMKKLD